MEAKVVWDTLVSVVEHEYKDCGTRCRNVNSELVKDHYLNRQISAQFILSEVKRILLEKHGQLY